MPEYAPPTSYAKQLADGAIQRYSGGDEVTRTQFASMAIESHPWRLAIVTFRLLHDARLEQLVVDRSQACVGHLNCLDRMFHMPHHPRFTARQLVALTASDLIGRQIGQEFTAEHAAVLVAVQQAILALRRDLAADAGRAAPAAS
jgi:hypothetical protein